MDGYFLTNVVLLLFLVVTAVAVAVVRDLLVAIVLLGIFSLLMATMYLVMGAPDVAITEAAVGAGISTILLLCAITLTGKEEKRAQGNNIVPLLVVLATGAALIYATLGMPRYGDKHAPIHRHVAPYYLEKSLVQTDIPNVVTSVLASYRGYDTLGETTVIFTAAMSVLLLVGPRKKKKKKLASSEEKGGLRRHASEGWHPDET